MSNSSLEDFIEEARKNDATDQEITDMLVKNGWNKSDINSALMPKSDLKIPVPPPPAPHFGMWVAFLYIILFISLYVCATALGGILHYSVDELIPDPLNNTNYGSIVGSYFMQGYLASLIVGFPIFGTLFLILKKQVLKNPAIKGLRSRKVLVYLTLIGTFILMIGHLIGTVYGFLGGSLTTRSLAHLGVTLFVAGSIFFYFLLDVWGDRKQA